jgi:tetrahydromethanopterin S-methyltransferase subunit E
MKIYLVVTGMIFGLFGAFHIWATVIVLNRLSTEPGLVLGRAVIAIVACGVALWALRLFRSAALPPK